MTTRILPALWRFLQSPRLLFYVLVYFIILLVVGTLAQKYIGLFSATHLFFNSFFYWLGPVPVPAGASVLAVLFVNLAVHFITSSKWDKPYLGSTLAHLSILVLLFGGSITLLTKQEGFMLLRQNAPVDRVYDYHLREIVLYKNKTEIAAISANNVAMDTPLNFSASVPFSVLVHEICKNCSLNDKNELHPRDVNLEDEVNQWGFRFDIRSKDGQDNQTIAVTEFLSPQHITVTDKADYFIAVRRYSWDLPFSLRLENFTPTYYAGTDIAQSYESALYVQEINKAHTSWPALISMNDPLRYKGYTFYQSSFLVLPNDEVASVLNVVDNAGWLFPYIATFLLFAGLLVHLGVRRHAPN